MKKKKLDSTFLMLMPRSVAQQEQVEDSYSRNGRAGHNGRDEANYDPRWMVNRDYVALHHDPHRLLNVPLSRPSWPDRHSGADGFGGRGEEGRWPEQRRAGWRSGAWDDRQERGWGQQGWERGYDDCPRRGGPWRSDGLADLGPLDRPRTTWPAANSLVGPPREPVRGGVGTWHCGVGQVKRISEL